MRLIVRTGAACAVLACASIMMAGGKPPYKSAADQLKVTQLSDEIVNSTAALKARAVVAGRAAPAATTSTQEAVRAAAAEMTPQPRIVHSPDESAFWVTRPADTSGDRDWADPPPEPCPEGALFSQRVATYDDGSFAGSYSDLEMGNTVYENFWDVRGEITGLSWYGVFADTDMGMGCGGQPREFEVRFYADAGNTPGVEVAYFVASIVGEPTSMDAGWMAYAERYTLTFDPPLILQDGWVSIVGVGAPDGCIFSWLSCPVDDAPGDDRFCAMGSTGVITCTDPNDFWSWDMNLCLLGTFFPGACCDDLTGTCQDGVAYEDCLPPSRFEPGLYCADMFPACGDITGACCTGETCMVMTPSECANAGGTYKGDYVPCDPNPCVGACCLGENVCEVHTEADCLALGGAYYGDGTTCDPNPCPPINDDCVNAEPVTEGAWRFDTTYATTDGPQPCEMTKNVWYCYTASATGTVTVRVSQDDGIWWNPTCAAYDGCICDPAPTVIVCDDWGEGRITFDVRTGSQYLIEVGSYSGDGDTTPGDLSITLDEWPYGACCIAEPPYCIETYEQDCAGVFGGDGTTCEPVDCNDSGFVDACDIATGYSQDCNANGIPDECDIADGTSDDYDLNGVPDECDPDCNGNGVPDACDVNCATGNCASHPLGCGGSQDCQPDGIPDECQLGGSGGDETLLWDNGPPGFGDMYYYTLVSQIGGSADGAFIADDFYFPEGATINTFHASYEDEAWFIWSGRVRIEVYPDDGEGGPDDSGGPVFALWVPTDGGSVTRTFMGPGSYADRYTYDVTDLEIELGAGVWWIGMASETTDPMSGYAAWSSSQSGANVIMGEAHLRWPSWGINSFIPASHFWGPAPWDVAFTFGSTTSGADCNENLIPDECDINDCDGSPWCLDCNENGVPDGCEPDCNANGIADECDIRDCDGSPWCLDCNENGVPDGCESDCNANGISDECDIRDCDGSPWCQDCNANGVPDECDIATGTSVDYDLNGVPDECDPDCNGNGVPDGCDVNCATGNCASHPLGCGGSLDCQPDGIPDECQQYGEFEYLTDDGSSEDSVGLSSGGYLAWLTHFTVTERFDSVSAISLAWASVPNGDPVTVYLWSDPNGDGDPSDAQVLASAATTVANAGTNIFTTVDIPETYVGPIGTSFFVGAIMEHESGYHPPELDTDESQGQSWIAGNNDEPLDPNALGDAPIGPAPIDNYYSGNWLMRAVGFFNNDCNDNGIPDDCDIAADSSLDCNGNLVIDACEWQDCNNNGVLDDCDILDCDGSPWCSDCNGNGIPDGCDIAAGATDCQPNGIPDECEPDCDGNGIVDECDIRDCDGSVWCGDCNENGVPDVCDAGLASGAIYQYDDGTAENSVGIGDNVEIAWIQRFVVVPGSETIVAIATSFGNMSGTPGNSGVVPGDIVRVFVWDDPNGDGNPDDALLLGSASGIVAAGSIDTDVLQEVPINPVTVSNSFFVGAAVESQLFPTPMDTNGLLAHESWITFGWVNEGGFDPNGFDADNTDDIGYPCNFLLRAISAAGPAPNDCNGNGIPDDCDLCGDFDLDGDVDHDDYVIFLDAFGGPTDGSPAEDWCCDYDLSGAVGILDFAAWLECYRDFVGDPLAPPPNEKPALTEPLPKTSGSAPDKPRRLLRP